MMALVTGSHLGPYEILAPLGAGGMGEVYRARDAKLNRDVAIKVLPELFTLDPDRLTRFRREAQVLASLNHQNIGHIYGLEDSSGVHALVLELVEGPTLADRISEGPIPLDEALPIARQIADALECAHELGIIHRDLKPANIKLRPDGTVKVLDFGLAKALDPAAASASDVMNSPTLTARGTQLGMIVGTAAYMAPEQARGRAVDRRADIWAFGVLLYEMLTGKRAFEGDDVSITLASVLKDDVDWKALPSNLPSPVVRVLRRCLDKDPKRRLSAIGDARLELDAALQPATEELAARPPVPSRRWQAFAYMGILVAGAVVGALAFGGWGRSEAPPPPLVEFALAPPFQTHPMQLALSPDGKALAYFARETADGPPKIWVRQLNNGTPRAIPGTESAMGVFWSPNGQRLAFVASNQLLVVDVDGSVPLPVCQLSGFAGGTWNTDDEILLSDTQQLLQVRASGGQQPRVVMAPQQELSQRIMLPRFLPDGKRFLYTLWAGPSPDQRMIYVASAGNTPGSPLLQAESFALYASDHLLFLRQGVLYAQRFDPVAAALTGEPRRLYSAIMSAPSLARSAFTVAEGGILAFRLGVDVPPSLRVNAYDRNGKALRTIGQPGAIRQIRLSPDGKRIALERRENRANSDIYTMELATGISTRLTHHNASVFDPVWSPDSRRVAYGIRQGPKHEIFAAAVGDTQGVALVTSPEPVKFLSDWSPDGQVVLFHETGGRELFAADTRDGKTVRRVFDQGNSVDSVRISPDGHRVAFQSVEGANTEVYVADFPSFSRRTRVSSSGGMMPRWRRDGRELYYVTAARMIMAVSIGNAVEDTFGVPVQLFVTPIPFATLGVGLDLYDVNADGSQFFVIAEEEDSRNELPPITVVINWLSGLPRQ